VSKRAIEGGQLSSVDSQFVKDMIMQNSGILESVDLKIEEVEVLLQFICHDDITNTIGLPLLPLANGSFAVFEMHSALSKIYYVWESNSPRSHPVFRLDHLVHPKFGVKDFLDVGLNVEKLSGTAVKILIGDILDETDEKDGVDHTDHKWIATFWSEYHRLESDTILEDISSYPLVPTIQADKYISISRCRDRTAVLFSDIFEPDSLWGWLAELGITVVPRHSATLPVALQNILRTSDEFPSFSFGNLLALLEPASEAIIVQRFGGMSAKSREAFAEWARDKAVTIPSNLIPIAQRLPIWPRILARNKRVPVLEAAQNITMLPVGMPGEVARRFMKTPVAEFSPALRHLGAKLLPLHELIQRLQLPDRLPSRDVFVYKQLMQGISMGNCPPIPNFRVPNCHRDLSAINTLYGRDPLFLAAFYPGSQQFVLDELQEYEDLLTHHGLKRQADIDLEMFEACALAIHNDTSQDRVDRALVVFHSYAEELSVRLNFSDSWAQLDAIRFIPRGRARHTKLEGDISTFVKPFPDVVAPNEILQAQYEAIAWTQRALFGVAPNQRILVAYPTLGCPSVAEVVSMSFIPISFVSTFPF
jgi:sacsin